MLRPVYVAASRSQPSGWYIADQSGMPMSGVPAYRDRKACLRAIADLKRAT